MEGRSVQSIEALAHAHARGETAPVHLLCECVIQGSGDGGARRGAWGTVRNIFNGILFLPQ